MTITIDCPNSAEAVEVRPGPVRLFCASGKQAPGHLTIPTGCGRTYFCQTDRAMFLACLRFGYPVLPADESTLSMLDAFRSELFLPEPTAEWLRESLLRADIGADVSAFNQEIPDELLYREFGLTSK